MRVAIVGTGYVGLVTGACLAGAGHQVVCVDADPDRVAAVARGDSPIHEDGLSGLLRHGLGLGRLAATTDLAGAVRTARVTLVCVGTPSGADGIDLSAVRRAAAAIGAAIAGRQDFPVIAVKSTVTPGTTDTLVRALLEESSGMAAGAGFGLAMNPEFLSQGSAVRDFRDADRIVVGAWDAASVAVMSELYRPFDAPLVTMSVREAEMTKYAANALQATLISFANQIASLCEATPGCDHARVMRGVHLDRMLDGEGRGRAAAIRFLMGGVGFGGSCFPKDLAALSAYGRRVGAETALIDAVLDINAARPDRVLDLLSTVLEGLAGKRVAVLGLAFKPDTDDLRASPGVALARRLAERGAAAVAHDCLAVVRQRAKDLLGAAPVADTPEEALGGADAAVVATAWPEYRSWDWPRLAGLMRRPLVLDGRNVFAGTAPSGAFDLIGVGRHPGGPDGIGNLKAEQTR
ncbi:MAG: UDP-glucose/GDP-mannose dehydrogenase family protein [Magnetospirillum sp.]|nr:UDP-glucose/GDP-mannose dehydrogenase family protein [Magnetospirillum sp.]